MECESRAMGGVPFPPHVTHACFRLPENILQKEIPVLQEKLRQEAWTILKLQVSMGANQSFS